MVSEAQKRANAKYEKENVTRKVLKLYKSTDQDILDWLDGKVFATYVKELIRKDIQSHQSPSE